MAFPLSSPGPAQDQLPESASALKKQPGLAAACLTFLGKPLDKRVQVSDWEVRPLSPRQFYYVRALFPRLPALRMPKTYAY